MDNGLRYRVDRLEEEVPSVLHDVEEFIHWESFEMRSRVTDLEEDVLEMIDEIMVFIEDLEYKLCVLLRDTGLSGLKRIIEDFDIKPSCGPLRN